MLMKGGNALLPLMFGRFGIGLHVFDGSPSDKALRPLWLVGIGSQAGVVCEIL
jgi:hypothetical protein